MSAGEAVEHQPALDYRQAGPTAPRMILGAQLRRLREAQRISRKIAADAIRASESKISRLELGRTGSKARDVADLLTLYGLTDDAEREMMLGLATQANTPPWWHPYNDVIPAWTQDYLGLEQASRLIRTYQVQVVPELLQTADYARALIALGHGTDQLGRRVELRMRRQQVLHRPVEPAHLWAVIDEAALRRPIGGPAIMRAQLEHLIDVAALANVTVQVLPFRIGGHAATGGPVTMLRLPERVLPDMVYLEQLTNASYPDKLSEINFYWHVLNQLVTEADPPSSAPAILRRIIDEL